MVNGGLNAHSINWSNSKKNGSTEIMRIIDDEEYLLTVWNQ